MKAFFKRLLNLLHPNRCAFCKKALPYDVSLPICGKCMTDIPYIRGNTCLKCGVPIGEHALPICHNCRKNSHSFSGSYTPLLYQGSARNAIISMKFHNAAYNAKAFAFLICNRMIETNYPDLQFITFVPMSPESLKTRGYNQAYLVAKECGEILHLPVVETLERIDGTPRQSTLSYTKRRKNAKNSFFPKPMPLSGNALLIDDIYTTGATTDICSKHLLYLGCDKVYIACCSMTKKD